MTDLYNHYNGVDPGSIRSAASSLKDKVTTAQNKLSNFKTSLSDGVWKAGAKETLFTAFQTLDGEVYKEILERLANAEEIASNIEKYNTAKGNAEIYKKNLNTATKDTPQSSINNWQIALSNEEQTMRDAVSAINNLL